MLAGSAYQDRDLVFATAIGTPIEPDTIGRSWARVVAMARVGPVR